MSIAYAAETAAPAAHEVGKGIAIHLAPDVVTHIGSLPITSTLITTWVTMAVLIVGAYLLRSRLSLIPGRFQTVMETLLGGAYEYVEETLENKHLARKYFPILATIFFFILAANWIGLLPGVTSIGYWAESHGAEHLIPFFYPVNTDLNVTLALALIAFVTIEYAGITVVGAMKYIGKFINFHSPLAFFVGIIELISEFGRLLSFSFRLFGNIFAGKTLILVAVFFLPYLVPVPIMAFELFVGFIQAVVFAMLTLFFIKLAVAEPH
jgi:F-type H+-transporting ATPase subunit a